MMDMLTMADIKSNSVVVMLTLVYERCNSVLNIFTMIDERSNTYIIKLIYSYVYMGYVSYTFGR